MKKLVVLFTTTLLSLNVFGQTKLVSDPYHSRIQFSVTHMTIADITGNFEKANLTINTNEKSFVNSKISFEVDVNSINTHIEPRDQHLRSADFFDVEKFPKMTFVSTDIKKRKKNQYRVTGNLTLHGVTKPVVVNLLYRGSTVNQRNNKNTHGYQVTGTIKRSDFGVGGGYPEAMISDLVHIKGDFEMTAE